MGQINFNTPGWQREGERGEGRGRVNLLVWEVHFAPRILSQGKRQEGTLSSGPTAPPGGMPQAENQSHTSRTKKTPRGNNFLTRGQHRCPPHSPHPKEKEGGGDRLGAVDPWHPLGQRLPARWDLLGPLRRCAASLPALGSGPHVGKKHGLFP